MVGVLALLAGIVALALVVNMRGRVALLEAAVAEGQQRGGELRAAHQSACVAD